MASRAFGGVPDRIIRKIVTDYENGKFKSAMKQIAKLEPKYPNSAYMLMQVLTGKTIPLEVESSDTFEKESALRLRCGVIPVNMHKGCGKAVSHGTTLFGMKNIQVQEVVLVADGRSGDSDKVNKTIVYGKVAVVMGGLYADYNQVDKDLKILRKRLLRDGVEGTAERYAEEAWRTLMDRPVRDVESEKAVVVAGSVDDDVPSLWVATRDSYDAVHEDYVGEGSGGYIVETFLAEQNYVSTWSMENTIAIAKRAIVGAMEDPNTGGIVRIVRITSHEAQVVEKVLSEELAIREEERLMTIVV